MCEACKYPRNLKVDEIITIPGGKVKVIKQYQEPRNNEPDRKWYQVQVLGIESEPDRVRDMPCNLLCFVNPEGAEKIYSRPYKCECGNVVRFYYLEDIGIRGHWTCPECGLQLPFMFYDLKADHDYKPD